jgi:hypothetical protein
MPEFKPRRKSQPRVIFPGSPDMMVRRSIQTQFIQSMHLHLEQIALSGELIITDPFLLNPRETAWKWYHAFLQNLFAPIYAKVKCITFVVPTDKFNLDFFQKLQEKALQNHCEMRLCHSNAFHDRYWLSADNRKGLHVGNSLTGIGSKVSTLNMLPDNDALTAYSMVEPLLII